ncbi:tetratricopeptide repeat protein [Solimonas marina]|uniref:Tetratricopeptide repeat protein n=1 Tax=Solimonas marina TaxID=2714601 RepID=A0A969W6I1_9GAMM|nr:tetratricopeptide repeat protein [Solimonas marina]NKF21312.1 tetratricopeptide repeat protein [Solimonas marina]
MMNSEQAKATRDSITSLFASGRMGEGLKMLDEKGADLPAHVRLECQGNLHFYRRDLQTATHRYETAIGLAPDYQIARYHYLVGTQDEKRQQFVDAFKRYQAAIEAEPTFIDAYVELGGLLVKVGDLEGARTCYQDAARLAPNDIANLHNLKAVLRKLASVEPAKWEKDLLRVEEAYDRAVKLGQALPPQNQW